MNIFLENIKTPEVFKLKLTVEEDGKRQEFIEHSWINSKDDDQTLRNFAYNLEILGRMLDRAVQTESLFKE